MKGTEPDHTEVIKYLASYTLKDVCDDPRFVAKLKSIYKRHRSLLIWHNDLSSNKLWNSKRKQTNFRYYFGESLSDISQAIFLNSQGLYKPANLILRSGIENFCRSAGIAQGLPVLSINNTFDLFTAIRKSKIIKSSVQAAENFSVLQSHYKTLCKYVHTSDVEYMTLTAFLEAYPKYAEEKAKQFDVTVRAVLVSCCSITAFLFPNRLHAMHHKHADQIFDVLPAAVRRELSGH